ncbi:hypothetical protein FS0810_290008 [Tenacibaculum maritimum]|nr:hypothetical protein FS0810_290008 [Tenacibaculum maritimum]
MAMGCYVQRGKKILFKLMKTVLLYIALLISLSCSKKIHDYQVKPISIQNKQKESEKIKYLSGKIYPIPEPKKFHSAILLLHYNDSIKTYSASDFDGNFTFYDFKSELITEKSYIYAANKGCLPKKIRIDSLTNPIIIILEQDSINGLSHDKLIELHHKNRPID